ncbi:S8 family peptidase [Plantactinospora sp. S1510]|uniref:S8 family peptidase n=1 Tax=Plantactinospora alkalitolerans TaxID=2789879 RepID=A0ABS0GQE0_9ACTN|nr:S8 family peptidase [Plantactinospora alkalitolerans]MBF9128419.1 S8 family peptidase [Plantactinospora alkalitolerans]
MFDDHVGRHGPVGSRQPIRRRRGITAAAALLALLAGSLVAPGTAAGAEPTRRGGPAPLLAASGPAVSGSYIVVLHGKPGAAATARGGAAVSRATALGGRVEHRYHSALNGFSAKLTTEQVAALRNDPDVAYIAPDQKITLDTTQTPVTWGLDRIDQRDRPLNNTYDYNRTGAGVTVYVIDSGIRASHAEFGGRVAGGFTAINDGNGTNDCHGHGTHVAGTVGSAAYGVAKGVRLVPVRVFGCSPNTSTAAVVAGVDWVTANRTGPSVANMSLGGPPQPALDAAVTNSINAGVTYIVAAGNDAVDACGQSPAYLPNVVTVAASDSGDARTWFSNFGDCVALFAPGGDILSTGIASDNAALVASGTSMASPHVAGAAAIYLEADPTADPAEVAEWLTGTATPNVLSDVRGSPNRLLYTSSPGTHTAMTWRVKEQRADNVVLVGSDEQTNPYQGDTPATASLPILCLLETGAAIPAGITPDQYNGWAGGSVQLTPPVPGTRLTSLAEANRICATTLGAGWRMAEFHDGYYYRTRPFPRPLPPLIARSGWNLWANGTLPGNTRFWAHINDQAGNPWN